VLPFAGLGVVLQPTILCLIASCNLLACFPFLSYVMVASQQQLHFYIPHAFGHSTSFDDSSAPLSLLAFSDAKNTIKFGRNQVCWWFKKKAGIDSLILPQKLNIAV